jgi:cell division cycle 2-like protein
MFPTLGPSNKRSRWEDDQPKPQVKPKLSAVAPKIPPSTNRSRNASRHPSHSVFVPPRTHHSPIVPSRSVYCYERLNQIEEGSYGVVFRARDKLTGDIVALKKLKLDEEKQGFPITALREVNALMSCRHENVVGVREIVVGETLTQCAPAICVVTRPSCYF